MNIRLLTLFTAAVVLTLLPSCIDPPPGSESSIWQNPPRYGHGGTNSPKPPPSGTRPTNPSSGSGNDQSPQGRFGYTGDDANRPVDPAALPGVPPTERGRDPIATEKPPGGTTGEDTKKPSGGPPTVAEMPFAKGVPGKPLSVTLPPPYNKLGEISIEQYEGGKATGKPLPPGTPVEIPDPGKPGKKIYFKVP